MTASVSLRTSENFIRLLLDTRKSQALLLIENATAEQVDALGEIVENLLELDVPPEVKRVVQRNTKILTRLAKTTTSWKTKLKVLRKNAKLVLRIILMIKDTLLALL